MAVKVRRGGTSVLSFGIKHRRRPKPEPSPAPTLHLPNRSHYLLSPPIQGIDGSISEAPFSQSPDLWWPENRAWCVAIEIDFAWTVVGGDSARVKALIDDPELEVPVTQVDHAITPKQIGSTHGQQAHNDRSWAEPLISETIPGIGTHALMYGCICHNSMALSRSQRR